VKRELDLKTEVDGLQVSTVSLGINYGTDAGPLLFETMVFRSGDMGQDIFCDRYATAEAARRGHGETVSRLRNGGEDGLVGHPAYYYNEAPQPGPKDRFRAFVESFPDVADDHITDSVSGLTAGDLRAILREVTR
jgi:hypothetical protein